MAMIYMEVIIMAMIYKANVESIENGWDWNTALDKVINMKMFDEVGYEEDLYGVF